MGGLQGDVAPVKDYSAPVAHGLAKKPEGNNHLAFGRSRVFCAGQVA